MKYYENQKYKFLVKNFTNDKKITILENQEGNEIQIEGLNECNLGASIQLIFLYNNHTLNLPIFSLEKSVDGNFEYNKVYKFGVESVEVSNEGKAIINSIYKTRKYKVKTNILFEKCIIKEGEYINCKVIKILNDVDLKFLGLNLDNYYKLGEIYRFDIKDIHLSTNKNQNKYSKVFYITVNNEECFVPGPYWMYINRDKINEIDLIYLGDSGWKIIYKKNNHPYYKYNNRYNFEIKSIIDNVWIESETIDGQIIRLIKPFSNDVKKGDYFFYTFAGVTEKGYLDFKYFISFEDVIKSKALKIVSFDNLRQELKNSEGVIYENLFKDYDEKNNLWILSYSNALVEIVKDKIKFKQFDIAYILNEVLETIEKWVLSSGFIKSFEESRRKNIIENANSIIENAKINNLLLDVLTSNDIAEFLNNILNYFSENSFTWNEKTINSFKVLTGLLQTEPEQINDEILISILQGIKANKIEKKLNLNYQLDYIIRIVTKRSEILSNKIFREVFINPQNRQDYYQKNNELLLVIKFNIFLSNFYSQFSLEAFMCVIKLRRFISHYCNDFTLQEKIIKSTFNKIINQSYLEDLKLFESFNIKEDSIEILFEKLLHGIDLEENTLKNNLVNSYSDLISGKIVQIYPWGYSISFNKNLGFLFTNTLDNKYSIGDNISVIVIAYDTFTNFILLKQKNINVRIFENNQDVRQGDIVTGIIKSIEDYGLFINLGKSDGLLHSSKASHQSTILTKVFNIGQTIECKVSSITEDKIELDRKSLIEERAFSNKHKKGDMCFGVVMRVDSNNGYYLELENGGVGFLSFNNSLFNELDSKYLYSIGEKLKCEIIKVRDDIRYEVSIIKSYVNDPFQFFEKGKVIKVLPYLADDNYLYCKLVEYPIICKIPINEIIDYIDCLNINNSSIINNLIDCKIKEINDKSILIEYLTKETFFLDSIRQDFCIKQLTLELGYLFEQVASLSQEEELQNNIFEIIKNCFGISKSNRSYFYSYYSKYNEIVSFITKTPFEEIDIVIAKANEFLEKDEDYDNLLNSFQILSTLVRTITFIGGLKENNNVILSQNFNTWIEEKDANLNELLSFCISFNLLNDEHIKRDIWEKIQLFLFNQLKLIKSDGVELKIKDLRKRIRKIFENNIENNSIECKTSLFAPMLSKNDLQIIHDKEELIKGKNDLTKISEIKNYIKDFLESVKKRSQEIQIMSWVKTIAALANSQGGELIVGISEDLRGNFVLIGIDEDLKICKNSEDNLVLKFDELFKNHIGHEYQPLISFNIIPFPGGKKVIHIEIKQSSTPIYVFKGKNSNEPPKFYIRRQGSSVDLNIKEFDEYRKQRFDI